MKKSKKFFIIGIILLWVVIFLVLWGVTLFKKYPVGNIKIPGIGDRQEHVSQTDEAGKSNDIHQPEKEAVSVRCYKVSRRAFKDDLPIMGTIKAKTEIGLKFEVNGVVKSFNFKEGDIIYKGDLIAGLDKKDAQLKVDYAKSKLNTNKVQTLAAKKKYGMFKHLYEIGGIIKAKLEEVELEVQSAELQEGSATIELKSAESELDKTNLLAPRGGVLGSREVEEGEFVTPNDKAGVLYDTEKVFVELGIVEKDIDKIALGQPVTITVDAHIGEVFSGAVDNIFPVIEGKSRTLTVKAGIDNTDIFLLPGMFARAMITVAEFKDAIVVPSASLNKTEDGYTVFTVGETGSVSPKIVHAAYITTDYTVIDSGLYEGDLVVTDTPQELKDGMPVKIIDIQENSTDEE